MIDKCSKTTISSYVIKRLKYTKLKFLSYAIYQCVYQLFLHRINTKMRNDMGVTRLLQHCVIMCATWPITYYIIVADCFTVAILWGLRSCSAFPGVEHDYGECT